MKLFLAERESAALSAYMDSLDGSPVSSAVLRIEAIRAVRVGAASVEAVNDVRAALEQLTLVSLDETTLRRAEAIEPAELRTLDAIHLVTALDIGAREIVVYDERLADAARTHGLMVSAPGA